MKIGQPSGHLPETAATAAAPAAGAEQAKAASAASTGTARAGADASAKVELSSTAATLLSGGTASEFDAEKVSRISQAITSGTFKVNPEAIADKLIANAQELLAKVKG